MVTKRSDYIAKAIEAARSVLLVLSHLLGKYQGSMVGRTAEGKIMETDYLLIRPPLPFNFKEMSKEQAKEYLIWFQEQIPDRIIILTRYVRSFSDYRSWEPDLTPSSLDALGKWFTERVTTRKRSTAEIESIYAKAPAWFRYIEIPDYELSNQTFSLSIDVGMYLSQVFERNLEGLRWELGKKPKKNIDYQQPVLAGSGKLVFNPVHIVTTLAYSIAHGTNCPGRLREIYDIWSRELQDE